MLNAKDVVTCVLRLLQERDIPSKKVTLHKFLYFIDTQGVRAGLRFEPWTYGPFSFDLARTLNDMIFWDEIEDDNHNGFKMLGLGSCPLSGSKIEKRIEELFDIFQDLVGEFSFDNLECFGTVLYCKEAIVFQDEEVTEDHIVKEFVAWKGSKYPRDRIIKTYRKLKKYLH